jgi:hypothetical protein
VEDGKRGNPAASIASAECASQGLKAFDGRSGLCAALAELPQEYDAFVERLDAFVSSVTDINSGVCIPSRYSHDNLFFASANRLPVL